MITVNKLKAHNSGVPIVILLILTVRNEIKVGTISTSCFVIVSPKTKISSLSSGKNVHDHFVDINKMEKFIYQVLQIENRNF
ncbi:MAG: hypothetical protein Q8N83_02775 [Ignavibacteria bacterium]|nr:hypothetical protein [Ignavibacteria bacterium]